MKHVIFILPFLLFIACKSKEEAPYDFKEYHAQQDYQFEFDHSYKMFSEPTSYDFASYYLFENKMLIGNRSKTNFGVDIQEYTTKRLIHHIDRWEGAEGKDSINAVVKDMAMNEKYIFILQENSQVEVFDTNNYGHITTIGTGKWNYTRQGLVGGNGLLLIENQLFVRDREKLSVFDVSQLDKMKAGSLTSMAISSTLPQNNFIVQFMKFHDRIYFTDVANKAIYSFAYHKYHQGDQIHIDKRISLTVEAYGICTMNQDIIISSKDRKFYTITDASGSIENFPIVGYSNRDLGRIFCKNNTFWFSDTSRNYVARCNIKSRQTEAVSQ
ncbi:hypothetical protein K5X82_03340 [Halosquirtibacter xylanolyticus]|uniref:hypothetical protein n=1 Tax=Halosquirtibacter xylanolyticus TaxID=3374599 RepID=UPI00374A985A|nr:hypothetical protein K5X82_03340 [Prolixibacteraceae bacterium]